MTMNKMEITQVTEYLTALERELGKIPHAERLEIVNEIHAHITDRIHGGTDAADVLRQMGDPAELGREYAVNLSVASAARSRSPLRLFWAAGRLAFQGVKGFGVFLVALIGYGTAFSMFLTVLLKPIFPDRVGLWIGNGSLYLGWRPFGTIGERELLGDHFTLYVSIAAFLAGWGTTELLRVIMRKWRH